MKKNFIVNLIRVLLSIGLINSAWAIDPEELKTLLNPEPKQQTENAPPPPSAPTGKASIELENNENSRIVIDYRKEAAKTEAEKEVEEQKQREKTKKFKAFYKKPDKCYDPDTSQTRIDCANEYIRAKAKFEDLYKQGKI